MIPVVTKHLLTAAWLLTALGGASVMAVEHQAPPEPQSLPEAATDALAALPALPAPTLRPAEPLPAMQQLAPGVSFAAGAMVVIDGAFVIDQGPVAGMEVLACLREGKTHEALVRLDVSQGHLVKAACIAAFGLPEGTPSGVEHSGQPARGTPMQVTLRWTRDGAAVQIAGSSLVRDRVIDRAYPALPYLYTGSRFEVVTQRTIEGKLIQRQVFMLDSTRSLVVNFDEPDALFASPIPGADTDVRFEANSRLCPPPGTPVQMVIAPATVPVKLTLADDGSIQATDGTILDDGAITTRLVAAFPADYQGLRAIGVLAGPSVSRTHDVTARARLLKLAASAQVWAVPVFTVP